MLTNLKSFKSVLDSPSVFVSREFLEPESYVEMVATFPTVEMKSKMGERYFSEIDSERHRKEFLSVVSKFRSWSSLFRDVSGFRFRRALLTHFRRELSQIRGVDSIRNLRLSDTEVKCSFHLSRNGYLLAPHTDTGLKLITIILYLPDSDEVLVGAGTRFYRSRDAEAGAQFMASLLTDQDKQELAAPYGVVGPSLSRVYSADGATQQVLKEIERFDAVHECILETSFTANQSVLFIKSNHSWHDVRLKDLQPTQLRKSFVINFSAVPIAQRNLSGRVRRYFRLLLLGSFLRCFVTRMTSQKSNEPLRRAPLEPRKAHV